MTPAPFSLDSALIGFGFGFALGGIVRDLIRWAATWNQAPVPLEYPAPRRFTPLPLTIQNQVIDAIAEERQLLTEVEARVFVRFDWSSLNRAQLTALWCTTTAAELTGAGKPFSRAEWERVRDLMVDRGLAFWRDPAHHGRGWELRESTRRAIVRQLGVVPRSPIQGARTGKRVQDQAVRTHTQGLDTAGEGWELR